MDLQRVNPGSSDLVVRIERTVDTDWVAVVAELCRKIYGIQSAECSELAGYDDMNFKLSKCMFSNGKKEEDSFTFKFVNYWEAKFYPKLCEAQADLSKLLANEGINCPQNVKTINGLLYFGYHLTNPELANAQIDGPDKFDPFVDQNLTPTVLRTFVPGSPLGDWVNSSSTAAKTFISRIGIFCDEIGTMIGNFHAICDRHNFNPSVFHQYAPIMALEHWHFNWREFELQKRTGKIDAETAKLCAEVFEEFEQKVLARRSEFERGLIHSDLNESNILVTEDETATCRVSAVIDFSDVHCSFRISDIANAILYLYLLWSDLVPSAEPTDVNHLAKWGTGSNFECHFGGLCRAYSASFGRPLPRNDLCHLKLFLRARLVLSLVNGLRTKRLIYGQNGMDYVLKTQKTGKRVLKKLSNCSEVFLFDDEISPIKF